GFRWWRLFSMNEAVVWLRRRRRSPRVMGELRRSRWRPGLLFSSAGSAGRHSEGRWTDSAVGNSYGRRQNRPGGRQTVSGAPTGTDFPCGLLWISTWPVGDRCPPEGSSALLAVRLGARYRREE